MELAAREGPFLKQRVNCCGACFGADAGAGIGATGEIMLHPDTLSLIPSLPYYPRHALVFCNLVNKVLNHALVFLQTNLGRVVNAMICIYSACKQHSHGPSDWRRLF
jgi:hypothetical protein